MRYLAHRPGKCVLAIASILALIGFNLAWAVRSSLPARAATEQGVSIADAMAQARSSGESVVATAESTETATVQANPDGTLTANVGAGPVQEPDPSAPGGWSPIDLTLQPADGAYAPTLSAADTTFSDGGTGTLATLVEGATTYTEGWNGSLPTPVVAGATATYPGVLPGIDLVLEARTAGFAQSFVVHAPPQSPLVLEVPLTLSGLSAHIDEVTGALIITDGGGKEVATASTAVMFGAATGESTDEPLAWSTVPTSIVQGESGPVLQVRPDPAFFTNPATTYPVSIDPAPNLSVTTDTYVRQGAPTSTFSTDNVLKVGTPDGSDVMRSMVAFDISSLLASNPITVASATLNLYETDSGSCTASEVDVYAAGGSWSSSTTWNTKPSAGTLYASVSTAHGFSGACPSAAVAISTGGASGSTLGDLVQAWADGTTNNGIILQAASETSTTGWKKFKSSDAGSNPPTLTVTYNTHPDDPTDLSTEGADTATPTLHATFSDPDGGVGQIEYTVYDDGSAVVVSGLGSEVTSGSDDPITIGPDTLTPGADYTWQARAFDGSDYSDFTSSQSLTFEPDTPLASDHSFIVDCGYVKTLDDDPIGQIGNSHNHDFFANPRTVYNSTEATLENATLDITEATEPANPGTTAKFTLVGTHHFNAGDSVRVDNVNVSGYNGTWVVATSPAPTNTKFWVTGMASGLATGTGGTAGAAGLSCGSPHGALTYDTAAYWSPSVYLANVGSGQITPARMRIYYLPAPKLTGSQTVEPIPAGLQLSGGEPDATSPTDNPHLHWTCGKSDFVGTPIVGHPYDCGPYRDLDGSLDGPVGIVEMPYCYSGSGTDVSETVYPENDNGATGDGLTVCDGDYAHALVQLSMRLHIGAHWVEGTETTTDPCGGCVAYNLDRMRVLQCNISRCKGELTVSSEVTIDWSGLLAVNNYVDVRPNDLLDPAWNSPEQDGWQIIAQSEANSTITVSMPTTDQGLHGCMSRASCGSVASHAPTENFTFAGGEPGSTNTNSSFYTLHTEFWNTWDQDALNTLEIACVIPPAGGCLGDGSVPDNHYIDGL